MLFQTEVQEVLDAENHIRACYEIQGTVSHGTWIQALADNLVSMDDYQKAQIMYYHIWRYYAEGT